MSDLAVLLFPSQEGDGVTAVLQAATPGERVLIVDWAIPGSALRGRKAELQRRAGEYVNRLLALAGLGNGRCLSMAEWEQQCRQAGLVILSSGVRDVWLDVDVVLAQRPLSVQDRVRLRAMLVQAPEPVRQSLTPQFVGDRITFRLQQLQLMAQK